MPLEKITFTSANFALIDRTEIIGATFRKLIQQKAGTLCIYLRGGGEIKVDGANGYKLWQTLSKNVPDLPLEEE